MEFSFLVHVWTIAKVGRLLISRYHITTLVDAFSITAEWKGVDRLPAISPPLQSWGRIPTKMLSGHFLSQMPPDLPSSPSRVFFYHIFGSVSCHIPISNSPDMQGLQMEHHLYIIITLAALYIFTKGCCKNVCELHGLWTMPDVGDGGRYLPAVPFLALGVSVSQSQCCANLLPIHLLHVAEANNRGICVVGTGDNMNQMSSLVEGCMEEVELGCLKTLWAKHWIYQLHMLCLANSPLVQLILHIMPCSPCLMGKSQFPVLLFQHY